MLQFRTNPSSTVYNVPEQAQMVIEGGCKWIQMSTNYDSTDALRNDVKELMTLCSENDVILTIDHNVELVNELKVHGVDLFPGDMLPSEAREFLGPHAIIGVSVKTSAETIALKKADIDYVQIGVYPTLTPEDYKVITSEISASAVNIPVVAVGEIKIEDLKPLYDAGVKGFVLSSSVLDATDPTDYFRRAVEETKLF